MATEPALEQTGLQGPAAWEEEAEREQVHGLGPWRLGLRRLKRNKVALAFGFLFMLLVAACLAAPLWADNVAKTGPNTNHLSDTIQVDGETVNVVGLNGVPIGPQYLKADGKFFLGADRNGLDIMGSFPVIILGVALGVALALGGFQFWFINVSGDSLLIPIGIIGLVYVPYMARPVRGQVLSLREKEFVEAARAQGAGPLRIMF